VAEHLQGRGIECVIVDATGGNIGKHVGRRIEDCDMFLIFGTSTYGEDTGTPGCTSEEYEMARKRKKKIFAIRMIPFEEEFKEYDIIMYFAGKLFPIWLPNSSTHQWSRDGVQGGDFTSLIDHIAEAYEAAVHEAPIDPPTVTPVMAHL